MAFELRNLRKGVLVIAFTAIVLEPGGAVRVNELSEPIQHAARRGYIQIITLDSGAGALTNAEDEHPAKEGEPVIEVFGHEDDAPPPPAPSLAGYNVTDAVTLIGAITEVATLESFLVAETGRAQPRKTLVSALNRRIGELKGAPKP